MADSSLNNIQKLYVSYQNGKEYYPPSIPKKRGWRAVILRISVCCFSFICDIWMSTKLEFKLFLMDYTCGFVLFVLVHLIHRMILLSEECRHFNSRYKRNVVTLFKDTVFFSKEAITVIICCFFYIIYYLSSNGWPHFSITTNFHLISIVITVFLLGEAVKLTECGLTDSLLISKIHGLDYGSGMAYSFMYGYLKLVLPKSGQEDKNLKELMQDYEAENRIKFCDYKLFILIPKSLRCFVSLQNEFSPSMDESKSLPEKRITVAGVQNRSYKNAVYKIKNKQGKKIYICAEYASPLKTYNDVFKYSGENSVYYKKYQDDITLQFYLTLKEALKIEKLDEFCELIFFEDSYEDPQTNKTNYYDVGKILMCRLQQLKKYRLKEE